MSSRIEANHTDRWTIDSYVCICQWRTYRPRSRLSWQADGSPFTFITTRENIISHQKSTRYWQLLFPVIREQWKLEGQWLHNRTDKYSTYEFLDKKRRIELNNLKTTTLMTELKRRLILLIRTVSYWRKDMDIIQKSKDRKSWSGAADKTESSSFLKRKRSMTHVSSDVYLLCYSATTVELPHVLKRWKLTDWSSRRADRRNINFDTINQL